MALKFLQETSQGILSKLKTDLSYIDPSINLAAYQAMPITRLRGSLRKVRESVAKMKKGPYGSWLREEKYVRDTLLEEALRTILEQKHEQMSKETLVSGSTYYTNVARFGNILEGKRAQYTNAGFTEWVSFRESTAVAKAMTILRHGTEADFREIYVGLADGTADALNSISIEHITESSPAALRSIEAFCNSRWTGPWPWEVEAPEKFKHMIETRKETRQMKINEMQRRFTRILREFEEGGMGEYEMVAAAQDMMTQVDSMVSGLAKLSGSGIEIMAQAKSGGDDGAVEPLQHALGEPLNNAVSALTDLKAALSDAMGQITGGGGAAPMGGDDLGSPADAMGGNPSVGKDDVDALADVDIGGDEEERAMKGM